MSYRVQLFLFLIMAGPFALFAKSIIVKDITQFNNNVRLLVPGDTLCLANGIWKDSQFVFKGNGISGKYIYLTAETPGKVSIEGESLLRISGKWLHISGLTFTNGHTPGKVVIEFRTSSKDYAFNCVLSNCAVDRYNQLSKEISDHWIGIWGRNNTVEHCYFAGKSNEGTTLVIWPNGPDCINNHHLVYRNYFGARPPLGVNGGETIRIGTSDVSNNVSASVIKENYFEKCNGEGEIISNKSCANQFLSNTFFECEGTLTLRHGNNALVAGNWFIGNGKKYTGGVRVINDGHIIINNYFYKLAGEELKSALSIMNGIPDSPPEGYGAVKNVIIAHNTFIDCTLPWNFCIGSATKNCSVTPQSTLLINNLVVCPHEEEMIVNKCKTEGIALKNNLLIYKKGVSQGSAAGNLLKTKNFEIPYTNARAAELPVEKYNIPAEFRNFPEIGAYQKEGFIAEPLSSGDCGPVCYKPAK